VIKRLQVQLPVRHCSATTTIGKLFTPLCLCHQAVYVGAGGKTRKVMAGHGKGVVYCP